MSTPATNPMTAPTPSLIHVARDTRVPVPVAWVRRGFDVASGTGMNPSTARAIPTPINAAATVAIIAGLIS